MKKPYLSFALILLSALIITPGSAVAKPKNAKTAVGYANSQKTLNKLIKNKTIKKIVLKGEKTFTIPDKCGRFLFSVAKGNMVDKIVVKGKKLKLTVDKGAFLNSLTFAGGKNADLKIKGKIACIYVNSKSSLKLDAIGKKSFVSSVYLKKPSTLNFKSKSKNDSCIYVLEKSDIILTGNGKGKSKVFIKDSANESTVTLGKRVSLYTAVRLSVTMNKGSEKSAITTLDYQTPVTVTNNTAEDIIISTPSIEKTVEAGSTHTVNGKEW